MQKLRTTGRIMALGMCAVVALTACGDDDEATDEPTDGAADESTDGAGDEATGPVLQTAGLYDCGPIEEGAAELYVVKFGDAGEFWSVTIAGTADDARGFLGIDETNTGVGEYVLDGTVGQADTDPGDEPGVLVSFEVLSDTELALDTESELTGFAGSYTCTYSAD